MHRLWISWSEDTMLTRLEQLYYVATAAAHLYSRTIVWFYIFQRVWQKQNSRKVSFTRCTQLQSTDRAPARHFKHSSPVKPAQQTGAKGCLSQNNRRRREKAGKLAANRHLGCLLNVEAWKSECQSRQVCLLKQATWIPLNTLNCFSTALSHSRQMLITNTCSGLFCIMAIRTLAFMMTLSIQGL